ncbi:MAG TPA: hypothetical protein DDY68_01550 [Porphyromonadaceae bacterium]|nr:hypothetical protein [Porphyromonadaceae bacterium]
MVLKRKNKTKPTSEFISLLEIILLIIVLFIAGRTLIGIFQNSSKLSAKAEDSVVTKKEEIKEETPVDTLSSEKEPNKVEEISISLQTEDIKENTKEGNKQVAKKASSQTTSAKKTTTSTTPKATTAPKKEVKKEVRGAGGYGYYSVKGRSLRTKLPYLPYKVQKQFVVVIDVAINKKGDVTWTRVAKGTTTKDQKAISSALSAAKNVKFSASSKQEKTAGTITYKFLLKPPVKK